MADDPILSALARLEAGQAKLEAEQERLREQLNTKLDDILDKMSAIRQDTDTVRGHVLYGLQENLTLSQRVTKIEEEMRKR
jgi:cytochrome c556